LTKVLFFNDLVDLFPFDQSESIGLQKLGDELVGDSLAYIPMTLIPPAILDRTVVKGEDSNFIELLGA
jgi:hypothetical protein